MAQGSFPSFAFPWIASSNFLRSITTTIECQMSKLKVQIDDKVQISRIWFTLSFELWI
jgi:hypothetical protein